VVSAVENKFKIIRENIKLVYNEKIIQGNFKLNLDIPHHIIHVVNKAYITFGEIIVSLTINNGNGVHKVRNIKA